MGGHDAQQNLRNNRAVTSQKYFAVARMDGVITDRSIRSTVATPRSGARFITPMVVLFGVVPDDCANAGQEKNNRDNRPHEDGGGQRVPTDGSYGQLLVYVTSSPSSLLLRVAPQAVQK